jgi:5'-deoxynucleotidase YfbR-like HD superfamily hydrolase
MSAFANFLFEVGMLNHTPRTGFQFLGSGKQSVAEHSFRMLHVAWLLARRSDEPLDELHLLHLVMFHDLPETRTGDFNYVYHRYDRVDEGKLYGDLARELPYGEEIVALEQEFEARATPEARVANDADQLELLLTLKEQQDLGNPHVADWIPSALARLRTPAGKKLAEEILETPSDQWWFSNKRDQHWVNRGREGET